MKNLNLTYVALSSFMIGSQLLSGAITSPTALEQVSLTVAAYANLTINPSAISFVVTGENPQAGTFTYTSSGTSSSGSSGTSNPGSLSGSTLSADASLFFSTNATNPSITVYWDRSTTSWPSSAAMTVSIPSATSYIGVSSSNPTAQTVSVPATVDTIIPSPGNAITLLSMGNQTAVATNPSSSPSGGGLPVKLSITGLPLALAQMSQSSATVTFTLQCS